MKTLFLSLMIQDGLQLKGWIVTISGFFIVLLALIVLFLIFSGVAKLINLDWKKLIKKDKKNNEVEITAKQEMNQKTDDDVMAAIALALSLSVDVHDEESGVITIKRVERRNSPWCSKIYGLNNINAY